MRVTEHQTVRQEVTVAYRCDVCGADVKARDVPEGWFYFLSGHSEWGNDSIESSEWHSVCSFPCFVDLAMDIAEDHGWPRSLEIAGMDRGFLQSMFAALGKELPPGSLVRK